MCGIIGYLGNDNCFNYLLDGLKQLQNRGYDSAGIASIDETNNSFVIDKFISDEHSAIHYLENKNKNHEKNHIGIGHTRWATHGPKTKINSHPHCDYYNVLTIVHNGIIENYSKLKQWLVEKDYKFKSETDTEVIANLISYYYLKENLTMVQAIEKASSYMEGTWGLVILNKNECNKIYFTRHGSPLLVGLSDNFCLLTSERSGFCNVVKNYIALNDNNICYCENNNNKINFICNEKYKIIKNNSQDIQKSPEPYPHWTLKEIEEQIDSSHRAIGMGGRLLSNDKIQFGGLIEYKDYLKTIQNLILLGCGTSLNACILAKFYFKDLADFNTIITMDGADFNDSDIPKFGKSIVFLLSQSGETKDLHRCIEICDNNNVQTLGIVNVVDSLIARESCSGIYLNAGREVGVASTKSFTSQIIILSMIAMWFSQEKHIKNQKRKLSIDCLRRLSIDIKDTLEICRHQAKSWANMLKNKSSIFLLGKGKSEAIAKEGALKIKEISYIHAEGFSASSLKHGPFGILEKDFPVILIDPNDEHHQKMNNVYEEIKSRGAKIFTITDDSSIKRQNTIYIPRNTNYCHLLAVIPLQFLSYYLSLEKHINPDYPRNLAKVVTVE